MSRTGILRRAMMHWSGGFVVAVHEIPPQRLADLIDGLYPAEVIPLSELVKRGNSGKSCSGLLAITVDDGVGENVRALSHLFRVRQWPATFYLPTAYLDSGEPMAFQRWWSLRPLLPRRTLKLSSGALDLSAPGEIERLSKFVEKAWYRKRPEVYLPLTLELSEILARDAGIPADELQGPPPISWPEVEQLSRCDVLQFESHGVSHTAMSALSEEEIIFEMRHSQEVIFEHTGRVCRHFCYPFGNPESIGGIAPKLAARFYDSAVTMTLGAVDGANATMLPRIPLYTENSAFFARMKIAIKCSVFRQRRAKEGRSNPPEVYELRKSRYDSNQS